MAVSSAERDVAERAAALAPAQPLAEPGVLLAGIGPRDGIEEMLAEQMAGCHEAALSCLANARRRDLPESARTAELGTGARLMSLFTQQLGALERHRTHLRQEREAAESAERDAELRRRFAEDDAEREAEAALIFPDRHARRLAARAALAPAPQSVGAAVPPLPEPQPPLNRQQRRALERRRKRDGAGTKEQAKPAI